MTLPPNFTTSASWRFNINGSLIATFNSSREQLPYDTYPSRIFNLIIRSDERRGQSSGKPGNYPVVHLWHAYIFLKIHYMIWLDSDKAKVGFLL